jgi:hypothetical protein
MPFGVAWLHSDVFRLMTAFVVTMRSWKGRAIDLFKLDVSQLGQRAPATRFVGFQIPTRLGFKVPRSQGYNTLGLRTHLNH